MSSDNNTSGMKNDDNNGTIGLILGVVSLGLTSFFIVVFGILFLVLFTWVRRQVKTMRRYCQKEKRSRGGGGGGDGGERGIFELNQVSPPTDVNNTPGSQGSPLIISATNHAFTTSNAYEDTPTDPAHHTIGPLDSGKYTDISVGPLPAFLRNEEMLVPPTVSPEVIAAARESNIDEREEEEGVRVPPSIPVVPRKRSSLGNDDYVDPQDAKNEAAAMKQHDKIIKRVSKGRGKRSSDTSLPRALSDRDDYTMVVDALPQGDFERVDMGRGERIRTSSDASPMMRSRWSGHTGDSGKGSNNDSPSSNFQKSNSVRDYKRPKHVAVTVATSSPSKTQPIRRRSTLQQKELVSFDPQKGFKLMAKRTNSDGVPSTCAGPSDGQESPVSDPGQSFVQHGFDEGFIEGFTPGGHVYAAVDLKAKCRPEDDVLRREGVGVPEHYIAPVTCS